ncbi:MAG TPA: hypothetical protein VI299_00440 [Polyangiales bacterium]
MTQSVTVQTDFRDLQQMAEGLIGRVHATHVILPAGNAVDEGEWAQWAIALYDGSAGLAGMGRCVTVVDNGDEREAHQRFDVVFDSLQFDDHEQRVFEHILALHGQGGEAIEEVMDAESIRPHQSPDNSDGFVDVSTEFTGSTRVQLNDNDEIPEEATMVASPDELQAVAMPIGGEANDVVPARPAPQVSHASYGNQSAAVAHAVQAMEEEQLEEPLSGERIAPRPINGGVFAYANGIPFPAKPPRPDLEPSMRVTPAPRPAGSGGH